ncbi:hypothetical protein EDB92DRAFT_1819230 [Lactarius akahatsu]|uniref:Uncharacterized protein n=1 Tax=Lactarius akahatsu TaxID=416441 RepID=A0AAD4LC33_9AGAM|nr:hypothetical protein EDB92DRAFT_1820338 [Lactarius akahatsu]KAH8984010.1 hypothetical protein EDB92DRAFT_1819230 [Lactarius akahatsu]
MRSPFIGTRELNGRSSKLKLARVMFSVQRSALSGHPVISEFALAYELALELADAAVGQTDLYHHTRSVALFAGASLLYLILTLDHHQNRGPIFISTTAQLSHRKRHFQGIQADLRWGGAYKLDANLDTDMILYTKPKRRSSKEPPEIVFFRLAIPLATPRLFRSSTPLRLFEWKRTGGITIRLNGLTGNSMLSQIRGPTFSNGV